MLELLIKHRHTLSWPGSSVTELFVWLFSTLSFQMFPQSTRATRARASIHCNWSPFVSLQLRLVYLPQLCKCFEPEVAALWYTCTLVHLHFGTPVLWYTCTLVHLVHLFFGAPLVHLVHLWYTLVLHLFFGTPLVHLVHLFFGTPLVHLVHLVHLWYTCILVRHLFNSCRRVSTPFVT